jgi:hypothetical protein
VSYVHGAPGKAGVQTIRAAARKKTHIAADAARGLDSRLRGNDGYWIDLSVAQVRRMVRILGRSVYRCRLVSSSFRLARSQAVKIIRSMPASLATGFDPRRLSGD